MRKRCASVLIVEDSPTVRAYLRGVIDSDPGMMVAGEAADGLRGVSMARQLRPDVIVMDINMPRQDGVEATREIMREHPTSILIFCARSDAQGVARSFEALDAGALALIEKPNPSENRSPEAVAQDIRSKIKVIAGVKPMRRRGARPGEAPARGPSRPSRAPAKGVEVVAIGASTGGPAALANVLRGLPKGLPFPILVAQHMTPGFTAGLASWLASEVALDVEIARAGATPRPGTVYLAEDDRSLAVGLRRRLLCSRPAGALIHPSCDLLFRSVADAYGASALGVILTGMGKDGAEGLTALRRAHGRTLAQVPSTCVVAGMPQAAIDAGAIESVLSLEEISKRIAQAAPARKPLPPPNC